MKKILFFIIALTNYSFAQTWSTVGVSGFATIYADYIFSAVAPNGIPYVVYREGSQGSAARVMKFNGSSWVAVGSTLSAGDVSNATMAFDNTGVPYVAYTDWSNGYKATVMKFDGSGWVIVGTAGFTPGAASYTSIAIDSNGIPYVAFRDQGASVYNSWPNNYRASVMKYDGTNWIYMGTPGFSALGTGTQGALYTSLAIDANNLLYVAYADFSNGFKATVMKFNGSAWVNIGVGAISAGSANKTSIVIDSQGKPYVAYVDGANNGKATVMKFDGSNWIPVGVAGLSLGNAEYTSLCIDNNDMLYLAFKDYANDKKATVMTFNGSNWQMVGNPGFSATEVKFTTIAIDKNTGTLYTAYEDLYNGSTLYPTYDATVMKYVISDIANDTVIARFKTNKIQLCTGDSLRFTDASIGNILSWNWIFEGGTPAISNLQNPVVTYSQAGTYNAKLVVSNSTKSDSVLMSSYLTVNALPLVNLGNDTILLTGATLFLNAENPGSQYSWSNGDTSQTIPINVNGTYSVIVTDQNGCIGTDEIIISNTFTTSIAKNDYGILFAVYPNPAGKIITINITSVTLEKEFTLQVNDSSGKTVYSEQLKEITSSYTKQIDLSQLPKGIYFIELQSTSPDYHQKSVEVQKIVLQ